MQTGARLGLYAAGLVVAFGGAYAVAEAVVPDSVVRDWSTESAMDDHGEPHGDAHGAQHGSGAPDVSGTAASGGGYALSAISAPTTTGARGRLSFRVVDATGAALTRYTEEHERNLHLVVVRLDGSQFRHVHPTLDRASGTWSLQWRWTTAGTYRVYADFTPPRPGADGLTLSRTVDVAGRFVPRPTSVQRIDQVDGYSVRLDGDLVAGGTNDLRLTITRAGRPVTTLQPYLGAFGHLVALREGDLAYLHVHPDGDGARPGETSGPDIGFMAEVPTAGRYLLYLDFRVDGEVHTAHFVLDAGQAQGHGTHRHD